MHKHKKRERKSKSGQRTGVIAIGACCITLAAAAVALAAFSTPAVLHTAAPETDVAAERIAGVRSDGRVLRLGRRLRNNHMAVPSGAAMERALEQRAALLRHRVTVTIVSAGRTASGVLALDPAWLSYDGNLFSAQYRVHPASILGAFARGDIAGLPLVRDATVTASARDKHNVLRATTDGVAAPGFALDTSAAEQIAHAFMRGQPAVTLHATERQPMMTIVQPDGGTRTLTLLSTGYSDYSDSSPARIANVSKSLHERVNNIVVPPGETLSFVDTLDVPVTLEKGWFEEMGLFGGGAALTPGAGICQAATTVYRAALLAGLPIIEKRNHSLFVTHYAPFGIGLDATVFPGVHDLQFRNDTADDIVLQAYLIPATETAIVHIFGRDDTRSTTLEGPYFTHTKNRPRDLRALSIYEIGWVRIVKRADGTQQRQPIIATYAKPLWRSLISAYEHRDGMEMLHGAGK